MKEYNIFISFSNSDLFFALEIFRDLAQHGERPFLYEKTGQYAQNFWKKIVDIIHQVDHFFLIDSQNARRSSWVVRECLIGMELRKSGKIKSFIPCIIDPLDDTIKQDYYIITDIVLQRIVPDFSTALMQDLASIKNKIYYDKNAFLSEIKKLQHSRNLGGKQEQLLMESSLHEFYQEVNQLNGPRFFYSTHFDHDEIYRDSFQRTVDLIRPQKDNAEEQNLNSQKPESNSLAQTPEAQDFEQELRKFNIKGPNKSILVNDFYYFINRYKGKYETAQKRLDLLKAECSTLGYKLSTEAINIILGKEKTYPGVSSIEAPLRTLKEKYYGTQEAFEVELHRALNTEHYKRFKPLIMEHVSIGIKPVSIALAQAFLYQDQDQQEQAYQQLLKITGEFKKDARGWFARGKQELILKMYDDAISSLNESLSLINEKRESNYYQNHKNLVLYHKIMAQIWSGKGEQARETYNEIPEEHRLFPEIRATAIQLLLIEGNFKQALLLLDKMKVDYQAEKENWSSYKLTEPKIARLKSSIGLPNIFEKLEEIKDVFFPSKQSLLYKLDELFSGSQIDDIASIQDMILRIARYDREFSIDRYILANLFYQLSKARLQSMTPPDEEVQKVLEKCIDLVPEKTTYLGALAYLLPLSDNQRSTIINKGLATQSEDESDYYYFGYLYYLISNYEKARLYYKKAGLDWPYYNQL